MYMASRQLLAKPILKWAGGKGQLLPQIAPYFPPELKTGEIETDVEPFVGAGAVFFWIAQNFPASSGFKSQPQRGSVLTVTLPLDPN
ncbi:MAG: hypothetical protein GC158_01720 [Cyanobacteria bacterium RI_101]|nr:hypothetical protein [Cyanobacteria bacterium RI_101]